MIALVHNISPPLGLLSCVFTMRSRQRVCHSDENLVRLHRYSRSLLLAGEGVRVSSSAPCSLIVLALSPQPHIVSCDARAIKHVLSGGIVRNCLHVYNATVRWTDGQSKHLEIDCFRSLCATLRRDDCSSQSSIRSPVRCRTVRSRLRVCPWRLASVVCRRAV